MNDKTDSAAAGSDKYYLEDRERWESLGFDWAGWNATIEKILRRRAAASTKRRQQPPGEGVPG
jgi:hypothetical protein